MAIDLLFLIAAGYGFFIGYSRGIVQTIFTALAYLFGLMAAFKFAPIVTDILVSLFNNDSALMVLVGFTVTFFVTILIIRLISNGIEELLEVAHVNIVNQFAGGLLMASFIVLIYSVLVWFADEARLIEDKTKEQSISYNFLKSYPMKAKKVGVAFMPIFQNFWDQSVTLMDRLKKTGVEKIESAPHIYDIPDDNKANPNLPTQEKKTAPQNRSSKPKSYEYDE
jgi:membrane protein required for colicin V production